MWRGTMVGGQRKLGAAVDTPDARLSKVSADWNGGRGDCGISLRLFYIKECIVTVKSISVGGAVQMQDAFQFFFKSLL